MPQPIQEFLSPLGLLAVLHQVLGLSIEGRNAQITELQAKANPSGIVLPGGGT